MIVRKKSKFVFKLSMLIAAVSVLLLGIGVGVYFIIVNKNPGELLKPEQKYFLQSLENYYATQSQEDFDVTTIPEGKELKDVAFYSDDVIVFNNGDEYEVYSVSENE